MYFSKALRITLKCLNYLFTIYNTDTRGRKNYISYQSGSGGSMTPPELGLLGWFFSVIALALGRISINDIEHPTQASVLLAVSDIKYRDSLLA